MGIPNSNEVCLDIVKEDPASKPDGQCDASKDVFDINNFEDQSGIVPWDQLDVPGKIIRVMVNTLKVALVVGFLYLFISSLSFLADAFR